jgi:hypothetical protein
MEYNFLEDLTSANSVRQAGLFKTDQSPDQSFAIPELISTRRDNWMQDFLDSSVVFDHPADSFDAASETLANLSRITRYRYCRTSTG